MQNYAEDWIKNHKINNTNNSIIDTENTKKEISKLKGQEDRYTRIYSRELLAEIKRVLAP